MSQVNTPFVVSLNSPSATRSASTIGEGTTGRGEFGVALAGATSNPEPFGTLRVQVGEYVDFHRAGFSIAGITDHSEFVGGNVLMPYTAYLFTKFSEGALSGHDYPPNGAAHISDADSLQRAIWFFEDEIAGVGSDLQAAAQARAGTLCAHEHAAHVKVGKGEDASVVNYPVAQ